MIFRVLTLVGVCASAMTIRAEGVRGVRGVRGVPPIAGDSAGCAPNETYVSVPAATVAPSPLPFAVGERLRYNVSFGVIHVGTGEMWLAARDTTRGVATWRALFATSGGYFKLSAHDTSTSWFDSVSFESHRFVEHLHDPGYHANRDTRIYPDRRVYKKNDEPEEPSVAGPLDNVSLVYFVRTLPLEPHQCNVFHRYFKPDGNPIVIHVLRREEIKVPAGKFKAIVVRPEITTSGIFSKGGRAELWFSDDSARIVLQLKSRVPKLPLGSLSLYLTRIESDPSR
jgi:hypothetical protein